MSSTSKIHPIYVALDANQYNRAIKLCLALPKDNLLAQALLAHAYNKSMQRYKAILVLQSIVGKEGFQELQLECQYSKEAWDNQQAAANASSAPASGAVAKKAKKGKKKSAPTSKPNSSAEDLEPNWSLADHLESPPAIDENWQKLPPTEHAITDEVSACTLLIYFQLTQHRIKKLTLVRLVHSDNFRNTGDYIAESTPLFDKLSALLLGCC
jgi:hypothetical protein